MRTRVLLAALFVLAAFGVAAPATADVCYDVDVVLNGEVVVDEADCIETP